MEIHTTDDGLSCCGSWSEIGVERNAKFRSFEGMVFSGLLTDRNVRHTLFMIRNRNVCPALMRVV
jgi:hypothetical protein